MAACRGRRGDSRPHHALFPADELAWVQATQPAAWAALSKNHGSDIVPHPIDALPNIPPRLSISGHLIRDTVAAVQGNLA